MSQRSINFKDLSTALQAQIHRLIPDIVPGGKPVGNEYKAGSIYGGPGDSFSINLSTGKWGDFAQVNHKGGDLISLYAAIHNLKQIDAAKKLSDMIGFIPAKNWRDTLPNLISAKFGKPTNYWLYKNKLGFNTHMVVRYDHGNGKKHISQWHFSDLENKWVARTTPTTPLYNLNIITTDPTKTIVLCEGEKAADAAQKIFGADHVATTFMGGVNALKKCDLSPLFNRKVILWPDNDEPGQRAMGHVSKQIISLSKEVALILPELHDPEAFDAADLLESNLSEQDLKTWITSRIKVLKPIAGLPVGESLNPTLDVESSSIETTGGLALSSHYDDAFIVQRWGDFGLQMKSANKVFETEENVFRILQKHPLLSEAFYFDEFLKKYMTTFETIEPVQVDDNCVTSLKMMMQRQFAFGAVSTNSIKAALSYYMQKVPTKNSMAEQLSKLVWDQKPRINTFFERIYGVEDNEYTTAVSRIFWLSMVKRVLQPGCKSDIMVILEGDQGIKKSSSLELIAGKYYSVAGQEIRNKDFFIKLQGKFLMEMGELNQFSKSDHNALKEMLSTNVDDFRIPYGVDNKSHPRTCVFVGTTNERHYLKDETGNRRYLPVRCTKVDYDLLANERDQLFAEAYVRIQSGEDHWQFPAELAAEQTAARSIDHKDEDPWQEQIESWVQDVQNVRTFTLLFNVLNITDSRAHGRKESIRIAKIMKDLGYHQTRHFHQTRQFRVWSINAQKRYEICEDKLKQINAFQPSMTSGVNQNFASFASFASTNGDRFP